MGATAADRAEATRDELVRRAQDVYSKASKAGGASLSTATSYLAQATKSAKDVSLDNWSRSELKAYLDSYGIPVYQGSSINELRAAAIRHAYYFKYGTTTPQSTIYVSFMDTLQRALDYLKLGALLGRQKGYEAVEHASQRVREFAHSEL